MPDDTIVRRYIPLSRIRAARLTPDLPEFAVGPSMDYTGQPVDMIERANAQASMQRELGAYAEMQDPRRAEAADVEHAQLRQQDIIAQLEELMAQQQAHAQDVYGREKAMDALSQMPQMPDMATIRSQPQPKLLPLAQQTMQPVSLDTLSFGTAFRAARAAGRKTFTWRGRVYTTQMAGSRR